MQPLTSYPPDLEALFYDAKSMGDLTKQTGESNTSLFFIPLSFTYVNNMRIKQNMK